MEDLNFRKGDAKTEVFGSNRMLQPSPVEKIPDGPTTPEIAYQMVKDETFAQTQPRLNLATFVTTYMDEYATKLMNEAININYIDETEYPRIAVMNGKCINIVANLWNSPEKETWKTGALAIGSSEACMLGGVAAWLRWRKKRQRAFFSPNSRKNSPLLRRFCPLDCRIMIPYGKGGDRHDRSADTGEKGAMDSVAERIQKRHGAENPAADGQNPAGGCAGVHTRVLGYMRRVGGGVGGVRHGGSILRAGDVPGVTGHRGGVFDADALGTDDALGAAHRRGAGAALAACA